MNCAWCRPTGKGSGVKNGKGSWVKNAYTTSPMARHQVASEQRRRTPRQKGRWPSSGSGSSSGVLSQPPNHSEVKWPSNTKTFNSKSPHNWLLVRDQSFVVYRWPIQVTNLCWSVNELATPFVRAIAQQSVRHAKLRFVERQLFGWLNIKPFTLIL